MSVMNIALLGGVLVLVLLLAKRRRHRAAAGPGGAGEAAVSRGRAESAAASTTARPALARADDPAPGGGIDLAAFAAPTPFDELPSASSDAPTGALEVAGAHDPFAERAPEADMSWADEIISEPGWPMPGELTMGWQGAPEPTAPLAPPDTDPLTAPTGELAPVVPDADDYDPATGYGVAEGPAPPPADAPVAPEPTAESEMPMWSPPAEAAPALAAPEADDPLAGADGDLAISWNDAPAPEPPAPSDPAEVALEVEALADEILWLDEPAGDAPAPDAPAPDATVPDAEAGAGRFALGGLALAAGHEALTQVAFRAPLAQAPRRWAREDSGDAAPGTLVIAVEGAINCDAAHVEVMTGSGLAPTADGFTVRVRALEAGPFAVGGSFRIA